MAVFTVQNVPDYLKKQFKEACARNGESMAKATISLMMDYIARTHQNDIEEGSQ